MSINLNEAMQEYARLPIHPYGVHYKRYSTGHREPGYYTALSSFIFALEGQSLINLDGQPFEFGPNQVIHCAPNQHFTAQNGSERPAEIYELAYMSDTAYSEYMNAPYQLAIGNRPQLFSMLHRMSTLSRKVTTQEGAKKDGGAMLQSKMLTYAIFAEMFSSAQSVRRNDIQSVVEDAKSYLEQNYMNQHTLCALGGRYGMSGKYFAAIFKRYTGISPIEYLITCRLDAAKRLLQSTAYTVKEISYSVGYDDALYFSRYFKSRVGLSPSEWRDYALRKA